MKFKLIRVSLIMGLLFSLNAKAGTFDIFHPVKSAQKALVGGAVGYVAIKATADYLLNHPEKLAQFLETHPEKIDPLNQYVDKKIATAKNQTEQEKYLNFKDQLSLGVSESQALVLENDVEWKAIKQEVDDTILSIDAFLIQNNKMPSGCSIINLQQLLMPYKQFDSSFNHILPSLQSSPTEILNVNSYHKLKNNYKKNSTLRQNQDHIPSYAAIKQFLINKGINVNSASIPNKRNPDLEKNESAISLPEEIHQLGRTYVGRNTPAQIQMDAMNLLEATKKDIATTAYAFYKNPQYNINYMDYIKSGAVLYARNKMLCLYDL